MSLDNPLVVATDWTTATTATARLDRYAYALGVHRAVLQLVSTLTLPAHVAEAVARADASYEAAVKP